MDSEKKIEKIKFGKKFLIPLITICCLILLIGGIGVFLYFNDGNTKEIYSNIIDNSMESLGNYLDNASDAYKMNGDIKLNFTSDNALTSDEKAMLDIINSLSINYDVEFDKKEEKTNVSFDIKYLEDNILNADVNFVKEDTFVNLGSLYDKSIKMNEEDIKLTYITNEEMKTLGIEFGNVIKDNLKDEYFSKSKETITINDKDILTTKHILELNSQEYYDFQIGIIDDIKNNNKILEILAKYNNLSKEELLNELNSYRNEIELDNEINIKIEIYLNLFNKKLVKLIFDNGSNKITFSQNNTNQYDITYTENNLANLVGTLDINDDKVKLSYKYKETEINFEMNDNSVNLNLIQDGMKFNVNTTTNNGTTNYLYEIIVEEDGMSFKISMNGVSESIDKVSDKIINDYVNFDEMTEDDYLIIYERLYENETLVTLIEDISSLYSSLMYNNMYDEDDSNTYYDDYNVVAPTI